MAALVAALLVVAAPAAAATWEESPRGFETSDYGSLDGTACGGAGPSAIERGNGRLFVAGAPDGRLRVRPGGGSLQPVGTAPIDVHGLAFYRGVLYGTRPACGASQPPPLGCDLVVVDYVGGAPPEAVADVCGTVAAHRPGTSRITVATWDRRIVEVDVLDGYAQRVLAEGLPAVASSLAWTPDGQRLFYATRAGDVHELGAGAVLRDPRARGVLAPGDAFGLGGRLLVSFADGRLGVVEVAAGDLDVIGRAGGLGTELEAGQDLLYLGFASEVAALRGTYVPPPPPAPAPPPPPPPPPAAPDAPPAEQPVAAPPPPAPAPPPPAPPAPPAAAPVSAPAPAPAPAPVVNAGMVAQQGTAANVAMVPGQEDPEAAIRYAATGQHAVPAASLWLLLLLGSGTALGSAALASRRSRQPAWALLPSQDR